MKKWLMVIAAIILFCNPAYTQDECETEVLQALNKLKDVPHLPDEDKEKYVPQLKKALKLCREGKTALTITWRLQHGLRRRGPC